jgi:hypothetical protein
MLHRMAAAAAMALMLPAMAWGALDARPIGEPSGPVVLTVTGSVTEPGGDHTIRFDLAMLQALGITTLRTSTAWTTGEMEFEGVLARDLLEAVGADGREVVATALNDFVATIPVEELYRYPVLFAFKMNGEYLKVRDKGPLWIVYPRDQYPELRNSMVDKKWVWQLAEIEIR